MSIRGADDLTFDDIITALGGDRDDIDEQLPEQPFDRETATTVEVDPPDVSTDS
jgi:hypothetical protein